MELILSQHRNSAVNVTFSKVIINKYWLKTIPNHSKRDISLGRSFLG